MTLVALSASYGAGGSEVGPAVAELLGVEFVDRAIPSAVASLLEVPLEEAASHDDRSVTSWLARALAGFRAGGPFAPTPLPDEGPFAEDFHLATERTLRERAASGSGVILGRAATIVLREDPQVLRVRLDGPRERRVEQAMRLAGLERGEAERQLRQVDAAHAAYAMKFYRARMSDPSHFHMVLDSTALPLQECAALIARAAGALVASGGLLAGRSARPGPPR